MGNFAASKRLLERVAAEEAQHLAARVDPFWIGETALRAPARPGMAAPVQHPIFQHRPVVSVGLHDARIR